MNSLQDLNKGREKDDYMKKINALLILLISSLPISCISFIDGKIWDIIFIIIGMVAYGLVGLLFSIGVLHGKKAGKNAYAIIVFILIIAGYFVFGLLKKLRFWILSWPLIIKIIIVSIIVIAIITSIIIKILRNDDNIYD